MVILWSFGCSLPLCSEVFSNGNFTAECFCVFVEGSCNLQLFTDGSVLQIFPILNVPQGIPGIPWQYQIFSVKK